MSPFVLSVLKYALLVLLYFFIYRAVRSVASEVGGRHPPAAARGEAHERRPASRGRRAPASLVVHTAESGGAAGSFRLSGALEVGRAPACAVTLDDTYVSQQHARLFPRDGQWYVEDLGSTNGTFLNDRRVTEPAEVHAGDVVRVGKTLLELRR